MVPHVYPRCNLRVPGWFYKATVTSYLVLNKHNDPAWDILLNIFRCWTLPWRIKMHLKNTHTPNTFPLCEEIWVRHELILKSKAFHKAEVSHNDNKLSPVSRAAFHHPANGDSQPVDVYGLGSASMVLSWASSTSDSLSSSVRRYKPSFNVA